MSDIYYSNFIMHHSDFTLFFDGCHFQMYAYNTSRHIGINKGPKFMLDTSEHALCLSADSREVCKWCGLCLFGEGGWRAHSTRHRLRF